MSEPAEARSVVPPGQLERELAYYRRECNDLGARLLRLQEEQSQAFREARRSRTVRLPSGSLRFSHQLKLIIRPWNERSRNLMSSRPRPRSTL